MGSCHRGEHILKSGAGAVERLGNVLGAWEERSEKSNGLKSVNPYFFAVRAD